MLYPSRSKGVLWPFDKNIDYQAFYRQKSTYGGMKDSDAQELKQLKDENKRLKELLSELSLQNKVLKNVVSKTNREA